MFGRKYRIEDSPEFKRLIEELRERLRAYNQDKSDENLKKIQETQDNCRNLFLKGLEANQETDLWDDLDYLDSLITIKDKKNKKNYVFKKYLRQKIISLIGGKSELIKGKIDIQYSSSAPFILLMVMTVVTTCVLTFVIASLATASLAFCSLPILFGLLFAGIALALIDIGAIYYFRESAVEARRKAREEECEIKLLDTQGQITQLKKIEQNLVNIDTKSADELAQKNHLLNSPELDKAALEKAKRLNHFLHKIEMQTISNSDSYECYCREALITEDDKSTLLVILEITGKKNIGQYDGNVYFELDEASVEKINQYLVDALNPAKILGDDYFIKSIRADDKDFFSASFMWTVTRSLIQKIKFIVRPGEKENYRVDGEAVHKVIPKDENIIPVKYQVNHPFSQTQPTSYIVAKSPSSLFGHDRAETKLSGMAGKISDLYFSDYNSFYDAGTVNRPHHFQSKAKAEKFYEKKVLTLNPYKKIIYGQNELDAFLKMLADPQKPVHKRGNYNEVLAGVRWNTDGSSMLIIGTDDLETRLLTQYRAKILKERLIKQAEENNQPLDPHYEVPIVYYLPNNPNHLRYYTIFEQKKDLSEAKNMALSKDWRKQKVDNKNFEFLLMLDEENIEKIIKEDQQILLKAIFDSERLSILVPLMKKLSQDRLNTLMGNNELNQQLCELIKNHTHNYYPDLVELLFDLYKKKIPAAYLIKTVLQISLFQIEAPKQINEIVGEKIKYLGGYKCNLEDCNEDDFNQILDEFFKSLLAAGNTETLSKIMNCDSMNAFLKKHQSRIKITNIAEDNYALMLNTDYFNNLSEELTKQAWFYAIEKKDLKMVKKLLRDKSTVINIDMTNQKSQSALSFLLENKSYENMVESKIKQDTDWKIIKSLIQYNANMTLLSPSMSNNIFYAAIRTHNTKVITKLIRSSLFLTSLSDDDFNLLINFLIEYKKYKDFKQVVQTVLGSGADIENTKTHPDIEDKKIAHFKKTCSNFNLSTYTHPKISATMQCCRFLSSLQTRDSEKFSKISLHSIKDIDLDMLETICKILAFENKDTLAIRWAFNIIRNPKISKNDSELLKITQDINFDKMRAYKTLKNIVALIGQGSPEEKESFLRKIQFLYGCVQYKAPIVGHFKTKTWDPKPISNTNPVPQINNAHG